MKDNIDIFDFELTPEEVAKIDALDKDKRYFTMPLADQERNFASFTPTD